jgi:hypothetical protein
MMISIHLDHHDINSGLMRTRHAARATGTVTVQVLRGSDSDDDPRPLPPAAAGPGGRAPRRRRGGGRRQRRAILKFSEEADSVPLSGHPPSPQQIFWARPRQRNHQSDMAPAPAGPRGSPT